MDYRYLNACDENNSIPVLDMPKNPFWDDTKKQVDHEMARYWARRYFDGVAPTGVESPWQKQQT